MHARTHARTHTAVVAMRAWPSVILNIHVDDISLTSTADSNFEAQTALLQAGACVVDIIEKAGGLIFSSDKAQLISNDDELARSTAVLMGIRHGSVESSVRRIGYDYSLKDRGVHLRPGRGFVARTRVRNHYIRFFRLKKHATLDKKPVKIFTAGALPAVLFGTEVWGVSTSFKKELRVQALQAMVLGVKGTNTAVPWALLRSADDPWLRASWLPLERLHREIWMSDAKYEAAISLEDIARCWMIARRDKVGPIHQAIVSAEEAGWSFKSFDKVVSINGTEIELRSISPTGLKLYFQADFKAVQWKAYTNAALDKNTHWQDRAVLSSLGVDLVAATKIWYTKAYKHRIDRQQRLILMQVMAGSLFTGEKLKEWKIIPDSFMCPFCKEHDTIYHRLWTCTYGEHIRNRLPPAVVTLAKVEGSDSASHTRFWNPNFGKVTLAAGLELRLFKHGKQVDLDEFGTFEEFESLYSDGSCFCPSFVNLAAAGTSIIQLDKYWEIDRAVCGPLPGYFTQTAGASEHLAVTSLDALWKHKTVPTLKVDCSSVVKAASHGPEWATKANRPFAGIWKYLKIWPEVEKTKAHRTRAQAVEDGDLKKWLGNTYADEYARKGAESHAWSAQHMADEEKKLQNKIGVLKVCLDILQSWPPAKELYPQDVDLVRSVHSRPKDSKTHCWEWNSLIGRYRCSRCCISREIKKKDKCKILTKSQKGTFVWFQERGHSVYAIQNQTSHLFFCLLCGCYQSGRADGLNNDCKGLASKQRTRLPLMLEGKHPVHRHFMGAPRKIIPFAEDEINLQNVDLVPEVGEDFDSAPRDVDLFGDWNNTFDEQDELELGMSLQEQLDMHGSFDY